MFALGVRALSNQEEDLDVFVLLWFPDEAEITYYFNDIQNLFGSDWTQEAAISQLNFFSVIIMVQVFALFSLNLSTVSRTAFISVLHAVKLGPSSYWSLTKL